MANTNAHKLSKELLEHVEKMNAHFYNSREIEYQNFPEKQVEDELKLFGADGINQPSLRLLKRSPPEVVLTAFRRSVAQVALLNVAHPKLRMCQKAAKIANKHNWLYSELLELIASSETRR